MDFQDMEVAIKSAANSIRKTPAVRKGKNVSYAIVIKVGYEEIKKLREEGYSYDSICKIFSENGLLGANSSSKNFCTAFLRETKRRNSRASGTSKITEVSDSPAQKVPALPVEPEAKPPERDSPAISPPRVMHLPNRTAAKNRPGLDVKPDNTFTIRPIDLDDMPDI